MGRIVCREDRKLAHPDTTHLHLATPALQGRPTPDSPSLSDLDAPTWKRLINRIFSSSHEFVSLFEAIFTSEHEIEMIRDIRGDGAQTFADLVQQVHSNPSVYVMRSDHLCPLRVLHFRTFTSAD